MTTEMIRKQSKNIQFIITTHRPELVEHAHKWYKIVHHNKVSNIFSVSKEEALALLREVEQEEVEQQAERRETQGALNISIIISQLLHNNTKSYTELIKVLHTASRTQEIPPEEQ